MYRLTLIPGWKAIWILCAVIFMFQTGNSQDIFDGIQKIASYSGKVQKAEQQLFRLDSVDFQFAISIL